MKFIDLDTLEPEYNLAAEEHFFTKCSEPVFMLWQNKDAVIVGRNQNTLEEIDTEKVRAQGVHVVRRITGGGAVFHDMGNVNYTFIYPEAQGDYLNFRKFAQPIVDFLATLGVTAEFSGRNDLLIDGRKFSGNAQYSHNGTVLHHGTLMFSSDLDRVSGILTVNEEKIRSKAIKSVKSHVTTIREHMNVPMTVEQFKSQLGDYVCRMTGAENYTPTEADLEQIAKLRREKYDTWEWNYGYSPKYSFFKRTYTTAGTVEVHLDIREGVICAATVYGDFFALCPIKDFEQQLIGVKHSREELNGEFSRMRINDYFAGIQQQTLADCFF